MRVRNKNIKCVTVKFKALNNKQLTCRCHRTLLRTGNVEKILIAFCSENSNSDKFLQRTIFHCWNFRFKIFICLLGTCVSEPCVC